MSSTPTMIETMKHRLVLIDPESRGLYAVGGASGYDLPTVTIPQWTRSAEKIQRAVRETWKTPAIMLDYLSSGDNSCMALEALAPLGSADLRLIPLSRLSSDALSEAERATLEKMLNGFDEALSPFSQVGGTDRAVAWCEDTLHEFVSKSEITQYNGGGGFALLRLPLTSGEAVWLKATSSPNAHEGTFTACLSELCSSFVPRVLALREKWNAWLMEESGTPLAERSTPSLLAPAVVCLAGLQQRTLGCTDMLLSCGVFDQRTKVLQAHIGETIEYLIEAMGRQTSTKTAPLSRRRLMEMGSLLHDACNRMDALGIPDTVVKLSFPSFSGQ